MYFVFLCEGNQMPSPLNVIKRSSLICWSSPLACPHSGVSHSTSHKNDPLSHFPFLFCLTQSRQCTTLWNDLMQLVLLDLPLPWRLLVWNSLLVVRSLTFPMLRWLISFVTFLRPLLMPWSSLTSFMTTCVSYAFPLWIWLLLPLPCILVWLTYRMCIILDPSVTPSFTFPIMSQCIVMWT